MRIVDPFASLAVALLYASLAVALLYASLAVALLSAKLPLVAVLLPEEEGSPLSPALGCTEHN